MQRRPGHHQDARVQLRQALKLCEYLSLRQIFEIFGKGVPKLPHHAKHFPVIVISDVVPLGLAHRRVLQSTKLKVDHRHSQLKMLATVLKAAHETTAIKNPVGALPIGPRSAKLPAVPIAEDWFGSRKLS
jgi:hypothetical protein